MQTSLARRQRQRRLGNRRPRGSGAARAATVAIPLFLFGTLVLLGAAGAAASVAGYSYLAKDLEDPQAALDKITFTTQSAIYDRTGRVLLARLGDDRREVVTFDQIPPALVDATTSIEDKTFWDNAGFDPLGFVSAAIDTINGNDRGGSTITQQLVRARLLPPSAFEGSIYERKAKEIIQSIRLTEAYPGVAGKQAIIEKYLNQNFYGNRSYGVAAAARGYWDKDLKDLTLAQMALLAAIPQSPTRFDLVRNAVEETYKDAKGNEQTHLVVPPTTEVVQRRNFILDLMKTRSVLTRGQYTDADYEAAKTEPVVLASQAADKWRAAQFVWQARDELGQILCGDPNQCEQIDTGGYTVLTTLDYRMQRIVEKWVYAAAIVPNSKNPSKILKDRGIPRSEWSWIRALGGHNVHNAAAGVLDYRTGEVLAYAGSAQYTGKATRKFQPQFDVLSNGWRQPGSSIKPLVYSIGLEDHTFTAATMFMDVVTNFATAGCQGVLPDPGRRPRARARAHAQRGPVLAQHPGDQGRPDERRGPRVQPVPGLRADVPGGHGRRGVAEHRHPRGPPDRHDLRVRDHRQRRRARCPATRSSRCSTPRATRSGRWRAQAAGKRVISRQTAYIMTDILAGNTIRSVNPFWAKWRVTDGVTGSKVRPAAYKTGTTQDNRDVLADGYLAPPADKSLPALVAGVWMGNSDNSPNDGKLSLDTSAPLWSAIMSDVAKGLPDRRLRAHEAQGPGHGQG